MYNRQPLTHWSNFTNQAAQWDACYNESNQEYFQILYTLPENFFFRGIILDGELATDNIHCFFKLPKDPAALEKVLTECKQSINPLMKALNVYEVELPAVQFKEVCDAMKKANLLIAPLHADICNAVEELQARFQNQREVLANDSVQDRQRLRF
jgi:hypothetical protein